MTYSKKSTDPKRAGPYATRLPNIPSAKPSVSYWDGRRWAEFRYYGDYSTSDSMVWRSLPKGWQAATPW